MNPCHRAARLLSASALLFASLAASAQSPAPRIRGPIETQPSVPLAGSLNPHLRTAEDLGPLAPDTPIAGVTLVFSRSAAQEADLQQLLAQQADPSSSLYHGWLTPDQFAARFGLATSDLDAAQAWLESHGFTIDSVSRNRDRITFSGTAAEIQQAFGASLHHLRWNNELHFAPASELSLPASLAPVTAAVLHLSDFRPKPNLPTVHPDYTTASAQQHFLAPKDVAAMYDLQPLLNTGGAGLGQALAIVGQSFVQVGYGSSVATFGTYAGANPSITPVIVPGSGAEAIFPGDLGESEIDLEYASALASNASLFFVYTGASGNYDVLDALAFAITEDIAPVISVSYGVCEPLASPADLQQYNALFEQASAQGQTIVASSGDTGATACADYGSQATAAEEQQLAVSFPASSPNVTAVGGTQMAAGTFTAGASQYWNPADNGSDVVQSLLSYVPEVVWNEDSPTLGLLASGGGASSLFARPSWQTGVTGIPSGSFRLIPDIALQASVSSPGYLICSDDPYIVGSVTDCDNSLETSTNTYVVTGGTSFGAPIFAAFLTDLNQAQNTQGLGNVNPILYGLAAQPSLYNSIFHDITSGTSACSAEDGNCAAPGESAFAANAGYDQATGLGSLDFGNLASALPSIPANGSVQTYLQVSGIPVSADAGASSAVTITANIGCGLCTPPAPTGNVLVSVDGAAPIALPLVPPPYPVPLYATATWNFVAPSTTGSHVVVVRYPGDAYHLAVSSTFAVLVGNVVPSGSLTLSASNVAISANSTGVSQVMINPTGGYNGSLTWSSSYTGSTAQTICYLVDSPAVNGPTTATFNIGVGTACSTAGALKVPSTVQRSSAQHPAWPISRGIPTSAAFALLLFGIRRRKIPILLPLALLATISLTLSGCGGSGSGGGGGGGGGSQPQVYTVSLTAKDSVNTAITASTSFTLTVN